MAGDNSSYDIKQKLLNLQNELIKDINKKERDDYFDSSKTATTGSNGFIEPPPPKSVSVQNEVSHEETRSMLKTVLSNQQKIFNLLEEINRKIK